MESQQHIGALLAATRRRLRWRDAVVGGALALALGGGGVLATLLGLAWLGPAWRGAGWGAMTLWLGLAGITLLRPLGRWRSDEEVARELGQRAGLGDLVLSAVELGRLLPRLAGEPSVSPELVRALLDEVAARCRGLDARRLVPLGLSRRRAAAVAGVAAAYVLAWLLVPWALGRGWQALERPPRPALEQASEPVIGDLELRLVYPAYMKLPPRTIVGASGEILAPRGTKVELRGRALMPVRGAELLLEREGSAAPEKIAVRVKDARLETAFAITAAGSYRFVLHTLEEQSMREAEAHRIALEVDQVPRIELRALADDLEVTAPRVRVELGYAAEDDHGLVEIELVWQSSGETHRTPVWKGEAMRRNAGTWQWDLAEVELSPGTRVAYWFEVKDNDDVAGPNVGRSRTFYVHLYSAAQKHEEMLGHEQTLLEHAVALLGDRIDAEALGRRKEGAGEEGSAGSEGDPAVELGARAQLHSATGRFLDELGALLGDLEKDPLATPELRATASGIHQRLARLHRAEQTSVRGLTERYPAGAAPPRTALRPLRESNPRFVGELERDVLLLDDFIQRQRLEQLTALADEMAKARDRLKKLLSEYRNTRSETLRKEIERELRQLEQRLAELEAKSAQLGGRVPEDFLNREALTGNDMRQRLGSLREMLAKGDIDRALGELDRLSRALDPLAQSLEDGLRGFRKDRFSEEERALGELESELADLEHDQRELATETDQLRQSAEQASERHLRERVRPFLERARRQAAELGKKLDALDLNLLGEGSEEDLEATRRAVDDLGRALEQADIDQARQQARAAERGFARLTLDVGRQEQRQWTGARGPYRKARGETAEGGQKARELAEELERQLPQPDELLTPAERQRLEELRQRQAHTTRRLEELRRSVERRGQGQRAPGMLERAGQALKDAGQHMEQAERRLGQGEPRSAFGEQRQAADQLGALRQQVSQSRRPREIGGGGGAQDEVVKIPGADEYRAPRDFREDLLEAMKRTAPEAYREQIKRYYEELAR